MNWMQLLKDEVERTSITRVAAALDLSRTTVSLVLSGKYDADPRNVAERVLAVFGRVSCPHLGKEIGMEACRRYRERPVPMSHVSDLRHWRACYSCEAPERMSAGAQLELATT